MEGGFRGSLVGFRAQGCMRWQKRVRRMNDAAGAGEVGGRESIPCRSHPTTRDQGFVAQVREFGRNASLARGRVSVRI